MESAIKKIFSGRTDAEVHSEFVKFSKGVFGGRYLLEAKKQKDRWSIKTGAEFANFLVGKCLEEVSGKIFVKGIITSTFDIRTGMGGFVFNPEEEVKQFMGIKQLKVDCEAESRRIAEVMNKFPRAFFALSFSTGKSELKIKAKAPKSAKPSAGGEKEPKAEFCSLKTSNRQIVDDLFFDNPDFNRISIKHTIKINEILIPKGISSPVEMREKAVRKGVIVREVEADGRKSSREAKFET
jgi:hypothetical protein